MGLKSGNRRVYPALAPNAYSQMLLGEAVRSMGFLNTLESGVKKEEPQLKHWLLGVVQRLGFIGGDFP